jgi:hypothetical protein
MATAEKPAVKLCTKCGVNPKAGDEKDRNPWCQDCRNEYQNDRNATKAWRDERRGIFRGIKAMREHIQRHFQQWNGRPFMGAEVAAIISELPGPEVAPEDAPRQ